MKGVLGRSEPLLKVPSSQSSSSNASDRSAISLASTLALSDSEVPRRCVNANCNRLAAEGLTKCKRHAGTKRQCTMPDCTKVDAGGGFCRGHGGGSRCQEPGCEKASAGGGFCVGHGGGKRCQAPGCNRCVQGASTFCKAHGGGRRCQHAGCKRSAQGRSFFCIRHGGGARCTVEGCSKLVRRRGLCQLHFQQQQAANPETVTPATPVRASTPSPTKDFLEVKPSSHQLKLKAHGFTKGRLQGACLPVVAAAPNATRHLCTRVRDHKPRQAKAKKTKCTVHAGHCCPEGSTKIVACDAGKYCLKGGSSIKLSCVLPASMAACDAGSYCPAVSPATIVCDAGSFCPDALMSDVGSMCTLGNSRSAASSSVCDAKSYSRPGASMSTVSPSCTSGNYSTVSSPSTAPCEAGSYCPAASSVMSICDADSFCPDESLSAFGPSCTSVNYCPAVSSAMSPCDGGYYCPDEGKNAVGPICDGGYYCPEGPSAITPHVAGQYCPKGSSPASCPLNTCHGYYCPKEAMSSKDPGCTTDNYCHAESLSMIPCDAGHFCPEGSSSHVPCDEGHSCSAASFEHTLTEDPDCLGDASFYCPDGLAGQAPCDAGYYCPADTTSAVPCIAACGYPEAAMGSVGQACSAEHYCPEESTAITPCDAGRYCPDFSMSFEGSACTAGNYCSAEPAPMAPCAAAYCCPASSNNGNGMHGLHSHHGPPRVADQEITDVFKNNVTLREDSSLQGKGGGNVLMSCKNPFLSRKSSIGSPSFAYGIQERKSDAPERVNDSDVSTNLLPVEPNLTSSSDPHSKDAANQMASPDGNSEGMLFTSYPQELASFDGEVPKAGAENQSPTLETHSVLTTPEFAALASSFHPELDDLTELSPGSVPKETSTKEKAPLAIQFLVPGMKCMKVCGSKIKRFLQGIVGVQAVEIHFDSRTVIAQVQPEFEGVISAEYLSRALQTIGFEAEHSSQLIERPWKEEGHIESGKSISDYEFHQVAQGCAMDDGGASHSLWMPEAFKASHIRQPDY